MTAPHPCSSDLNSVGTYVADPRTLNGGVLVWNDEFPVSAAWDVRRGGNGLGEPEVMNKDNIPSLSLALSALIRNVDQITFNALAMQDAAAQAVNAAAPTD